MEISEQHRDLPMYPIVGLLRGARIVANFDDWSFPRIPAFLDYFINDPGISTLDGPQGGIAK
jgi:hypothetical protein